ncbi:MAG: TonB-dependent receptor, partial [Bacteroidales bacterium]|nr:TonB-dependent receptor [Bacteroidales bacterium]
MNTKIKIEILFLCVTFSISSFAQNGKIRGVITDDASGHPIPYVNVTVLNSNPFIGTVTDSMGYFQLLNLPIGRYNIHASFLGYESATFREVMVSSVKEIFLEFSLKENVQQLDEVVVRPKTNKEEPLNKMTITGARMLSVEEASRYAGGFDDPARLVTSFAGVAGGVSSNSISIRGNSPQSLQWKLEGIEIPNPSHYPDIGGVGGGILTAFSSQVLGNSDFLTGAFPSEYNNALSGVFDMQLRNGNNQDYEHTIQIGTLGVEFASEGPFSKDSKASYLFNYRYSSMALAGMLAPEALGDAAGMRYQDLSFKLNLPAKRAGVFSIWGIVTHDKFTTNALSDTAMWETENDRASHIAQQSIGAVGIGHKYFFNTNTYLKTTVAGTFSKNHIWTDWYEADMNASRIIDMKGDNYNMVFNTYLNKKFNALHTNQTGLTVTGLFSNTDYNISSDYPFPSASTINFSNTHNSAVLFSAFSQSTFNLTDKWTVNLGANFQYLSLNNHWTLEPRIGFKWQAAPSHSFAVAYGMHSRHEKPDYYFVTTPESGNQLVNSQLDFAKAHHFIVSYNWHISDLLHFKIEPYYQYLYDVPVSPDNSFS